MARVYETDDWEWKTLTIDGIHIEADIHVVGWYSDGDSFGYGCEPPDGDSRIEDIEIETAYNEETGEAIEITEELKQKVIKELS